MDKTIEWIDGHREPSERPDPKYPQGIDVDISTGGKPSCQVPLPYPAKRCGHYVVACECGMRVVVTTAGRSDDPRSVRISCKAN